MTVLYLGHDPDVQGVLTHSSFVRAMSQESSEDVVPCDVVVIDGQSDESLLHSLKAAKERGPDVSVIVIVPADHGEIATAALDLGADDVIPRTAVFERRLSTALRRAHDRAVHLKRQAERLAREERLRRVVDSAPDGISVVAVDGGTVAMNAAAARACGAGGDGTVQLDLVALATGALQVTPPESHDVSQLDPLNDRETWLEDRTELERQLAGSRQRLEELEAMCLELRDAMTNDRAKADDRWHALDADRARIASALGDAERANRETEARAAYERAEHEARQREWESEREHWNAERGQWLADRAAWDEARAVWQQERATFQATDAAWVERQATWEQERTEWRARERPVESVAPPANGPRPGLEAVGALAVAVAPDLEKALSALRSNPFAWRAVSAAPGSGDGANGVEESIAQASLIARQLAVFSRRQTGAQEAIDLQASLLRAQPLLTQLVGAHVAFNLSGATESVPVVAAGDDVDQLLTSLVVFGRGLLPVGGAVVMRLQAAAADGSSAGGPVLSLTALGYGVEQPADLGVLTQLAERCGAQPQISGEPGRSWKVDLVFRQQAPTASPVQAWHRTAVA